MSMTTYPTAAALRTRSESQFVLPSGAAFWQLLVPSIGDTASAAGYARGTGFHDAMFTVTDVPSAGADTRMKAMKDRPPRGVPR